MYYPRSTEVDSKAVDLLFEKVSWIDLKEIDFIYSMICSIEVSSSIKAMKFTVDIDDDSIIILKGAAAGITVITSSQVVAIVADI